MQLQCAIELNAGNTGSLKRGVAAAPNTSCPRGVIVMDEPSQDRTSILCAVCGTHTRVAGCGQQYGTLQARWGYGSKHDGERYRVHLCESCFFGALAYLRQERRINTMFDDYQPQDGAEFGLVARDDFFGES